MKQLQIQKKLQSLVPEPKTIPQKIVTGNGANVLLTGADALLLKGRIRSFGVNVPAAIPFFGGVRLSGIDLINGAIHWKFAKGGKLTGKLISAGTAVGSAKVGEAMLITGKVAILSPRTGDKAIQQQAQASPTATSGAAGGGLE